MPVLFSSIPDLPVQSVPDRGPSLSKRSPSFRLAGVACLLAFALGVPDAARADSLLDAFGGYPLIAPPTGAASADGVAWVETQAGRKTVWVASGEQVASRQVAVYGEDDGIPLSDLAISADAAWVAYVRGSTPNAQGEINNPLNLPDPQERALWAVPVAGGAAPRRIAGGTTPAVHSPAFAPDRARLAYARGKEAWWVDLRDGAAEPERLFTLRGGVGGLAWSPDGRHLAFVSGRGSHSFVGVFEIASRSLRYLAPGIDRDQQPRWSPDGRHLLFLREREEVQSYRFTERLEGIPWSILVADSADWSVRTLWTADRGPGSAAYEPDPFWIGDGGIGFFWEKTGWRQLYRVGLEDGKAVRLSQGEGEVLSAAAARDGARVHYIANAELRERFDLYSVAASGGRAIRLAADRGVSRAAKPIPLSGGRVAIPAYLPSAPARLVIADARGAAAPIPTPGGGSVPAGLLPTPEVVRLKAEDGFEFSALLFAPVGDSRRGKRPAVVYAHGGSRSIETLEPRHATGIVELLVASGYVVLVPNYRSGIGYGLRFREVAGYGGSGGTDTLDMVASGRYLQARADVDPAAVGIFGISYGGYLTTAALAKAPSVWAAGVSIVGVADWQMELELDEGGARLPFRLSQRTKYEDLAYESSAGAMLEDWRAPLLFISGDDDQQGWLKQSIELGQRLRRRGIPVEALVEPGGTHGPATHGHWRARAGATLEFFDRHLRAGVN